MNLIDFSQVGGYRFKQASLRRMQSAYFEILKAFVKHLGMPDEGNFIISGCTVVGPNITEGVVYINGELCLFEATLGTEATKIKKEIILENLSFFSGSNYPVFRSTRAIVDPAGVALSAFTRIQVVKPLIWDNIGGKPNGIVLDPNFGIPETETLLERILALEARPLSNVPIGLIAIWDLPASEIPDGWEEYIPLKGRMPVGHDATNPLFDVLGDYGGAATHTLTIAEMPEHSHGLKVDRLNVSESTGSEGILRGTEADEQTELTGGGNAIDIMNPYRIVHFIKYVGVA
ncbi:hypothetical protein [Flavobacterium maritimum]|uniref:hypothetical protein n=1 Tax=Flavobacterium maritimum TaxID=3149042 RepID=UPI0032B562D5